MASLWLGLVGRATTGDDLRDALYAGSATALLSDLVERGLDPEQGILFVIDGAKAPTASPFQRNSTPNARRTTISNSASSAAGRAGPLLWVAHERPAQRRQDRRQPAREVPVDLAAVVGEVVPGHEVGV